MSHRITTLAIAVLAAMSSGAWACADHVPTRGGISASAGDDRAIEITSEADGRFRVYLDDNDVPVSVKSAKGTIDIKRFGKLSSHVLRPLEDGTAVVLSDAQIKHGDVLRVVITLPGQQPIVSELRYTAPVVKNKQVASSR